MSVVVQIIRHSEDDLGNPVSVVVKSIQFLNRALGESFVRDFGNPKEANLPAYYSAEILQVVTNKAFEVVHGIFESGGVYDMFSSLEEVEDEPLRTAMRDNPRDAFRYNYLGQIIKLEGFDLGIHVWCTQNPYMVEDLRD